MFTDDDEVIDHWECLYRELCFLTICFDTDRLFESL